MVSLVVHQLRRTNPELVPGDAGTLDTVRHANIPAERKRGLLEIVWRQAGPQTLLSIGQGISDFDYDPIWHAAIRSASPALFFDKWRRFEVFAHSRNRLRIHLAHEKSALFQRYTVDGGTPTPPENLLICGLIIALLERIGCIGLRCDMRLDRGAVYRVLENGRFRLPADAGSLVTTAWTLDWQSFSPRAESMAAVEPPAIPLPTPCDPSVEATIGAVVRLLMVDVARQWRISELARDAGLSTRSLQRRLGGAKLSFSQLVRLVRIQEACRLLRASDVPITAVGFCAGFSDSAHFSRDFRASTGLTPSAFRELSVPPPGAAPQPAC